MGIFYFWRNREFTFSKMSTPLLFILIPAPTQSSLPFALASASSTIKKYEKVEGCEQSMSSEVNHSSRGQDTTFFHKLNLTQARLKQKPQLLLFICCHSRQHTIHHVFLDEWILCCNNQNPTRWMSES